MRARHLRLFGITAEAALNEQSLVYSAADSAGGILQ
jgi:hypothetical protein